MATFSSSTSVSPLSVPTLPSNEDNHVGFNMVFTNIPLTKGCQAILTKHNRPALSLATKAKLPAQVHAPVEESLGIEDSGDLGILSVHRVGLLCENLERSLKFYQNLLGLKINEARPHDKLPFRGAWLWVGSEMIHLMELPNPDPLTGCPEHGGRDHHTCIAIKDVSKLQKALDKAGIPYTHSKSGRPAIFTHDPDANALEFAQVDD